VFGSIAAYLGLQQLPKHVMLLSVGWGKLGSHGTLRSHYLVSASLASCCPTELLLLLLHCCAPLFACCCSVGRADSPGLVALAAAAAAQDARPSRLGRNKK
jgi:hypothetical protein